MSDMKMKLPVDRMSLETSHPLLTTLYADNDAQNQIKFQISPNSGKFLLVNSSSGDVILNKSALENVLQGTAKSQDTTIRSNFEKLSDVKNISVKISAAGGNDTAWTTLEIDVLSTEAGNCNLISQDLCFWHSVSYGIKENSPPTVIGSLGSPYLLQTCKGYNLNYALIKGKTKEIMSSHQSLISVFFSGGDGVELVPPGVPTDPWTLRTTRSLDRDIRDVDNGTRPDLINVIVECKLHSPQGNVNSISRGFVVHVLDVDDNPPESQEPELIIQLKSDVVLKASA